MEIHKNNLTSSNWIETSRSNAVDFGCSLSIMSYLSFAVISIYTVVNINVNNVRYIFFGEINIRMLCTIYMILRPNSPGPLMDP